MVRWVAGVTVGAGFFRLPVAAAALVLSVVIADATLAQNNDPDIQSGPRPLYLVDSMDDGTLKDALGQSATGPGYNTILDGDSTGGW